MEQEPIERDGPGEPGIEEALLGGERKYTRKQVADLADVPLERVHRLWRALGFAAADDDDIIFTDADVEAARMGYAFVGSGLIDQELDAAMTRALGHFLSRLAEWQVQVVWDWLVKQEGMNVDEFDIARVVEATMPTMERLQNYVWRRHLVAFAGRAVTLEAGVEAEERTQIIGFVDMVGYTRLTRQTDEHTLIDLLERFEALAADTISGHHGRIVKMIGDEVLFVADTPDDAVAIAFDLGERARLDDSIPELRTGLALGRVLHRLGDVFGETVNIAARLTSIARPDTILIDANLAGRIRADRAYELRSLRASVRGYSRLRAYALRRRENGRPSTRHH
ncbi:adenylate/guanylate cyclase domain-containing protein [Streptomyces sp. NBC_01803]|uniref:adenylate/guanylate cyclase domain-containing protein n=1 Tax=Streptomyces sp. NBC_01803 TaxID=2975946 RepID=UPI002DDC007E|nr:adenylate cyclase regulatory domain-containing protein [Streptomyces sp. NBC_01803]WSA43590.1 adenylate/guanylate cyclase domain-containing protein [Streptomyces sp. NBC_01803]